MYIFKIRPSLFGLVLLAAVFAVPGCGSSGPKLAPVSGTVTLDGTPLKSGTVNLVADESKGAKQVGTSSGAIGSDGSYRISTDGKDGAPLGWYKVVVVTMGPGMMPANTGALSTKAPAAAVQPKYSYQSKTDLSYEVTASPKSGAYDLKLSK
jgi:hypothetical protein